MLHTYITEAWRLRYPIIGAPMSGVAGGKLAHAVSAAGALGMIGVGSTTTTSYIEREAQVARGADHQRFGIGLMAWAIEARPELLLASLEARPFLIAISFGSPAPYVERLHQAGIQVATQVNTRAEAISAEQAGVDLVVVQGAEAGGHHMGRVSTLPLLQAALETTRLPVVAAGGIASARGLAAALAAGAEGAWIGTCLLASPEIESSPQARERVLLAQDTDTIHTRIFDVAQGIPWPSQYPGRALRNHFTEQWQHREEELAWNVAAGQQLREARERREFDVAFIYAGEGVGLVSEARPALDVIRDLGEGAERLLRERAQTALGLL
jgi:nitronate monooxygenase